MLACGELFSSRDETSAHPIAASSAKLAALICGARETVAKSGTLRSTKQPGIEDGTENTRKKEYENQNPRIRSSKSASSIARKTYVYTTPHPHLAYKQADPPDPASRPRPLPYEPTNASLSITSLAYNNNKTS